MGTAPHTTVLLLETIAPRAHQQLAQHADVTLAETPEGNEPTALLEQVEAILTRGRGQVTDALMGACPRLKLVARCGVGLDNVDVTAASRRGIAVINAPGATTTTLAEHTILLMLALERQLTEQINAVKSDDWNIRARYEGDECAGKTLGVVGLGAIGSRVAEIARVLRLNVISWNRSVPPQTQSDRETTAPIELVGSLVELLQRSDIVTLHVALNAETRELIGRSELTHMKRGARLINTARGALVHKEGLLHALDTGQLRGYAADGVDEEPPAAADPLIHHPHTLITPHSGALTQATYDRMCERTVANTLAYLAGTGWEAESLFNAAELRDAPQP